MNIGTNDVTNMLNKSSMAGQAPSLRPGGRVNETDRTRESDPVEEAEPEDRVESGPQPTPQAPPRRLGQGAHNVGRDGVQWQEQEGGRDAQLPGSLQPQLKGAGSAKSYNIPFWLQYQPEQGGTDNPMAANRRMLNGLRSMVNIDLQQYIPANKPPYSKKTLREFHDLLGDDSTAPPRPFTTRNEPAGYNKNNWERAASVTAIWHEQPQPGDVFEMVA